MLIVFASLALGELQDLEALVRVSNATIECDGGHLIFAPLGSVSRASPSAASFRPDVEGEYACKTSSGRTKLWRATALSSDNLNYQETIADHFNRDLTDTDDRFKFWSSHGEALSVDRRSGLNFDTNALGERSTLSSAPIVAANFMQRPRLLSFSNLKFGQAMTAHRVTLSLQTPDASAHVSLTLDSRRALDLSC